MSHARAFIVSGLILALFGGELKAQEESPTTWTDASGRAVEAEFVRLTDDGVVLRLKSTGREVETALSKLSLASHLQAIKLGNPDEWSKPLPKAYVPPKRLEPSNDIDPEDLLESPFTGDETIDQFIDKIKSENASGNYFIAWHCLPPKMQSDIAKLASKGMAKVGSQPLGQIGRLMKDVSTIINEKEEFVFNNPNIAGNPMVATQLKAQWPLLREVFMSLSEDGFWDAENFTEENIPGWMARFTSVFGRHHETIDAASGGMSSAALDSMFTVLSQTPTSAEIEFKVPPQPGVPPVPAQQVKAKKLGKIWIVNDWMLELRKGIDEGLKQVDAAPEVGGQISTALAFTVVPIITPLKNAKTQEEFDAAVENIVSSVGGLIQSQMGGAGGGGGAGAMTPSF